MVKHLSLLMAVFFLIVFVAASVDVVNAQRVYRFNYEYAKIWINPDGTIDLFYNLSLTLDSGDRISYVQIGQPNEDFRIGTASDQFGRELQTSEGTSFVTVTLYEPLTARNTIWFTLLTNVGRMISPDTMNPGNLGMQFAPAWRNDMPISEVRIQIVLPPNVTASEVETTADKFWNATSIEPDGRLAIYWETRDLQPNEQYIVGVSFPEEYLPDYVGPSDGGNFIENFGPIIFIGAFAVLFIGALVTITRKKSYLNPIVSMETLGIRRGLTAVEASYLLEMKPTQIVTEILYSLLKKRAVWAESTNPALRLRVMPEFTNKTGSRDNPLRFYEIDFLNAIRNDGTIDEEKLAHTVMFLRDTVEEKLRGYSREDTIHYYKKIVAQAWTQVEQGGTAELASKAYDEQLLWLLLDPNQRSHTETVFQNKSFEPNPLWFWYWYGYNHYNPNPTYKPNIESPGQSAKPPTIPGAEFANNVATAIEKTANNIVVSMEKFANSILPPSPAPKTSHAPAHKSTDCVCACAACACACACVSCACACAGGGVG